MADQDLRLKLTANALRALAIDAINRANSGHPGAPLGLAEVATVLWSEFLRFDPEAPNWINRDRFVLSNGHGSMLLYGLLHLSGYALSIDDLKQFRQLGSKTPGHPEFGLTPGVETTTGPLGQGFANAVGMALSQKMLAARLGDGDQSLVEHRIFGIAGDGCLMEGVASEAASLAGHLGLGNLNFVYDDNRITIDGSTDLSFSEDVAKRFQAMGWHVSHADGHDFASIRAALSEACEEKARPSIILARTTIGYGSPNRAGKSKSHGEPFGEEEGAETKRALGWTAPPFEVPEEAKAPLLQAAERGRSEHREWTALVKRRSAADAAWAAKWQSVTAPKPPADLGSALAPTGEAAKSATRKQSGAVLNRASELWPALVGGSADLAGSNNSRIKDARDIGRDHFSGRNIHFGIREHAMASVMNGMALHGSFTPFGATFLCFSDYMRPAIRLAALMKLRTAYIFTHDSIGLGEDGPTHQPVEHLWALRMVPGLTVWRPADEFETAAAWAYALAEGPEAPHALVLSRQAVAPVARSAAPAARLIAQGAYILEDHSSPKVGLVATGSEVAIASEARARLASKGINARLVSMPSVDRFLSLSAAERAQIVAPDIPWVSLEAGVTTPWAAVIGADGLAIGLDQFGESAPAEALYRHFGLDAESVASRVESWLADR